MKRKTSKILIGCLSVLCILGATSTVIGALSSGFKNWDTSTWFDKSETTENVTNEDVIATPDETQPIKMSVRYLSEEKTELGTIKKAQEVKPMTGLIITASLDSQYGECSSFSFSFDINNESLLNYTTTDTTCTVNFLKKYFQPVYLTAKGKANGKIYTGKIKFDFMKGLSDKIYLAMGSPDTFFRHGTGDEVGLDFSKEVNTEGFVRVRCTTDGTKRPNMSFVETRFEGVDLNVDWTNLFIFDGTQEIIKLRDEKDTIEKIIDHSYFNDKTSNSTHYIGSFYYKINNEYTTSNEQSFKVWIKLPTFVDGGVDMGGDIIVG